MIKHETDISLNFRYDCWKIGNLIDFSICKTDEGTSYSLWIGQHWFEYGGPLGRTIDYRKMPF
jgi:hypothetical protein